MQNIRRILKQYDDKRGTKELPRPGRMSFESLWAIGLFTCETRLCSEFQADLRSNTSGCKWRQFEARFLDALFSLKFVQNMG